jgi:hypothetical protein
MILSFVSISARSYAIEFCWTSFMTTVFATSYLTIAIVGTVVCSLALLTACLESEYDSDEVETLTVSAYLDP